MPVVVANFIRNPRAGGKFVVLRPRDGGEGGVVAFSDFDLDSQHVDVVRRWETGWKTSVAAAGMRPAGGGWWKYETPELLVVYGRSIAYGRFDAAWLRKNLPPGRIGCEARVEVR